MCMLLCFCGKAIWMERIRKGEDSGTKVHQNWNDPLLQTCFSCCLQWMAAPNFQLPKAPNHGIVFNFSPFLVYFLSVGKSCWAYLQNISKTRPLSTTSIVTTPVQATNIRSLDYCYSLLTGSPAFLPAAPHSSPPYVLFSIQQLVQFC